MVGVEFNELAWGQQDEKGAVRQRCWESVGVRGIRVCVDTVPRLASVRLVLPEENAVGSSALRSKTQETISSRLCGNTAVS
eukprot:1498036-Rhodomonas_salina.1